MSKLSEPSVLENLLKAPKGEALNFAPVFDQIKASMNAAEGVMITSLPRGSLQIAQPPRVAEGLLKAYSKDFHAFDRPTWAAIQGGKPVRAIDCWHGQQEYENSRYCREFLAPQSLV